MIKPVNISNIGIEPIKVPHQNNVSFSGLKVNTKTDKQAATKVLGEETVNKIAKKVAPYYKKAVPVAKEMFEKAINGTKKAGKFIKEKAIKLKEYISKSISSFCKVDDNSGKKGRTLMKLSIALGATAGAGGVTKSAISHNKKDSK